VQHILVIGAVVLAVAWLPLAYKFNSGWKRRKNPVSLAICVTLILLTYSDVIFAFAILGETTWKFFAIATGVFQLVTVANFYLSFYWSEKRFPSERRTDSVQPPNTTSTPRQA